MDEGGDSCRGMKMKFPRKVEIKKKGREMEGLQDNFDCRTIVIRGKDAGQLGLYSISSSVSRRNF